MSALCEILSAHSLTEEDLKRKLSKGDSEKLSKKILDWNSAGAALGLSEEAIHFIDDEYECIVEKSVAVIRRWRDRNKDRATYLKLAELLVAGGLRDLAGELCSIISLATPHSSSDDTSSTIKLTERHVAKLMTVLHNYSYKWYPFGLNLGFTPPELNTIVCTLTLLTGAPVSYLQELLSRWVQWPTTDHPLVPTLQAMCEALRSSLVGLGSLADKVEKIMRENAGITGHKLVGEDKSMFIAATIEDFQDRFRNLQKHIVREIDNSKMSTLTVLNALTLLPPKLKKEYEESITENLPTLEKQVQISSLFLRINPLLSFIDYGLLEYIINQFGSPSLKGDMTAYSSDMQMFMKDTTIQQLIDHLPGQQKVPPNFEALRAKIGKDARTCTLAEINRVRTRVCAEAKLSDIVFHLIALESSNSFILTFLVPSVLVPDVVEFAKKLDESFFQNKSIIHLSVGNRWVYNNKIFAFGAEMKLKYQNFFTDTSHIIHFPLPNRQGFRLATIQREAVGLDKLDEFSQTTISFGINDIVRNKNPVELENIIGSAHHQSEIVLIEGAASSGKTALSEHICKKWGKGELFEQFSAVVLVQLSDPAVQSAKSIADLLPFQDVAVAQEYASEIIATNGRGILWVLDGWDELPPHLQQDSIFRRLIPPTPSDQLIEEIKGDYQYTGLASCYHTKEEIWNVYLRKNTLFCTQYYNQRYLNESSIVVTSRPVLSGNLCTVVSSRLEILGFTPAEQRQYFAECLKGNSQTLRALLSKIKENPGIHNICYLPLNAALTVDYFKLNNHSLYKTKYELLSSTILDCIKQHFKRNKGEDIAVASLFDLLKSEVTKDLFQQVCQVAYHGLMENKSSFSLSDLPDDAGTLDLFQAVKSFKIDGKSLFYKYSHLSFQEFLAAMYMASCLSDNEQVAHFRQFFHEPRFISTFHYYGALTMLKAPEFDEVFTEIASNLMTTCSRFLPLLHCLFEAKEPALCQALAEKLRCISKCSVCCVYTPLDCLAIGYFLSTSENRDVKAAYICSNDIGNYGITLLMKYMYERSASFGWKLNLRGNVMYKDGVSAIANALQSSTLLYRLTIRGNPIGGRGLLLLSKALITNSSLVKLDMSHCSLEISKENGPVLTEMLRKNKTLRDINLAGNSKISDLGVFFIAEGLKRNTVLEKLNIPDVGPEGGKAIAEAVAANPSLRLSELRIFRLQISEDSGPSFVDMLHRNKSLKCLHFTQISDVGVSFIAEGLLENSTVERLFLYHCNVTAAGARHLSTMLIKNSSITSMGIGHNPIGDVGVAHLASALKENRTLRDLDIRFCKITDDGVSSLADAFQTNQSLGSLVLSFNNRITMEGIRRLYSVIDDVYRKSLNFNNMSRLFGRVNVQVYGIDAGLSMLRLEKSTSYLKSSFHCKSDVHRSERSTYYPESSFHRKLDIKSTLVSGTSYTLKQGTTSSSSTSDPGVSVSATASSYGRPKLKRESRRPRSRLTSTLYSYPTMYSPVIRHAESETSSTERSSSTSDSDSGVSESATSSYGKPKLKRDSSRSVLVSPLTMYNYPSYAEGEGSSESADAEDN